MASESPEQFIPLRKKQKRASTGVEDNFVPSYMPQGLFTESPSQDIFEKASTLSMTCSDFP